MKRARPDSQLLMYPWFWGEGYFEAITMSFVSDALANDFRPPEAATLPRAYEAVRKADAHLRPSLLPGLLSILLPCLLHLTQNTAVSNGNKRRQGQLIAFSC